MDYSGINRGVDCHRCISFNLLTIIITEINNFNWAIAILIVYLQRIDVDDQNVLLESDISGRLNVDQELRNNVLSDFNRLVESLSVNRDGNPPIPQNWTFAQLELVSKHAFSSDHISPFLHLVTFPILKRPFSKRCLMQVWYLPICEW